MSSPAVSRHRLVDRAPRTEHRRRPPARHRNERRPPPATRITGRYRYDRRTGDWWWSPEMFTLHGLPAGSPPAGHRDATCSTSTPRTGPGFSRRSPRACATGPGLRARDAHHPGGRAGARRRPRRASAAPTTTARSSPSRAWPSTSPSATRPARPPTGPQALQAEVGQLRAAMASRASIEQAKGILMLLTSCSDQVAFDLLAHISSHTHRKVRDVALVITESAAGRGPAAGRRPRHHPGRLPAPQPLGKPGCHARGGRSGECPCRPPTRPSARAPRPRGGETRRALPHRPIRAATDVPDPPADHHRPGERAGRPARSSSRATTCPSSTASPSRSWRPAASGYLAKAEYFTGTGISGWLTRTLFTALGALPVERETHRAAQVALDTAMTVLNGRRRLRHLPGGHALPRRPARPRARPASPGWR